ncbi:hypothetical protein Xbed_02983 [Xenorhabdus beddingii]|uniref:Uncharacterized protein n=1 Tax=Xenorhabdus beddingii TaxID=40578 RepID=A0A1Y2SMA6_9GAMM|nr:hypothetical protein Xbed_02983 [Xenorhabdus beddingii]
MIHKAALFAWPFSFHHRNHLQNLSIFYCGWHSINLPAGTRLDVRVQMPKDSVWNVGQGEAGDLGS